MLTIIKSKGLKKSIKIVPLICLLSFGFSYHSSIAARQSKPQTSNQSVLAQKETSEVAKEVNTAHDKENAEAAREVNIAPDRNHLITEVLAAGINSDHALKYFETQFDTIKLIYTIALGIIGLIVTVAGIVGYKSVREMREEVKKDIKDAREEAKKDIKDAREEMRGRCK